MKHLTDEQLAEWLAGTSSSETESHLESCAQCRTEALQVRDGISRYTLSMRQQSAQAQSTRVAGNFVPPKEVGLHRWRWAGLAVMALLLAVPTAWIMKSRPPVPPSPATVSAPVNPAATAQMSDDELLKAVNNDLNREVPQALAPVSAITNARNKIAAASGGAALPGNDSNKNR